jgi:enediyne polyketide synthase
VRKNSGRGPWAAPLLGPYLERALSDLLGANIAVAVEPGGQVGASRRAATEVAVGRVLGRRHSVRYRPDGRPQADGGRVISVSHGAGVTLCAAASATVGCDVEPVTARSQADWAALLGSHAELARLTAGELGEDADTGCTRVWTAIECLQKAGWPPGSPLTLAPAPPEGWAVFACAAARIATFTTTLCGADGAVTFTVLTGGGT